jgi:hypothetical protein
MTIEQLILQVDGVQKVHQLRSRSMGSDIFIDVHILVSPYISVSEGHYIAQHVHQTLMNEVEKIKDVTVHVDPEDDEITCPSLHLPNRKTLEDELLLNCQKLFPEILDWKLHYLDGQLTIDLICDQPLKHSQSLTNHIKTSSYLRENKLKIRLLQQISEIQNVT